MKTLSIITPCYNEELSIKKCYDTLVALFEDDLKDYKLEYIICDNASTDNTVNIIKKIAKQDPRVKLIINANNFGVFRSIFNGVMSATGDAVVPFLPADMQDPPEVLVKFVHYWEQGYRVVYGQRIKRQENFFILSCRKIFYRFVRRFSKIDIPVDAGEFQLIDRKVVEALKLFDDHSPYLRGMIATCGFKSIGVKYRWLKREGGKSKFNFFRLLDYAMNGVISTTTVPIRFALWIGFLMSVLSLLYAVFNVALYYVDRPVAVHGIMLIIVAIFFFGGVQLFFLALIGEYIASIHAQVRKAPLVVEEERVNF